MSEQLLPETECPECHGPLDWIVVIGSLGRSMYNGLCVKCSIILRDREVPDVTKGKALEANGNIDGTRVQHITASDPRITSLPGNVQIGILRERHRREVEKAETMAAYSAYLKKLSLLEKGWDSYDADPPNSLALRNAQGTLDILEYMGASPERITPTVDGGVLIWLNLEGKGSSVSCLNSGEIYME